MNRWPNFVLRRRLLAVLVWLVVAASGGATASSTVDALRYGFSLPDQPAYETNSEIVQRFGGGGLNDPLLLVRRSPDGPFARVLGGGHSNRRQA